MFQTTNQNYHIYSAWKSTYGTTYGRERSIAAWKWIICGDQRPLTARQPPQNTDNRKLGLLLVIFRWIDRVNCPYHLNKSLVSIKYQPNQSLWIQTLSEKVLNLQIIPQTLPKKVLGSIGNTWAVATELMANNTYMRHLDPEIYNLLAPNSFPPEGSCLLPSCSHTKNREI